MYLIYIKTDLNLQIVETSLIENDEPIAETFMDIKDMLEFVYENETSFKKVVIN